MIRRFWWFNSNQKGVMKTKAGRIVVLAIVAAGCWTSGVGCKAALSGEASEAEEIMQLVDAEQREAASSRARDKKWTPATTQVALIQVGDKGSPGALRNYCLNKEGNILACFASPDGNKPSAIRVYSPEGELLKTIPVEIKPTAICVAGDESMFVAGEGKVLKLDKTGKVLASATSPVAGEAVSISPELEEMIKEMASQNKRPVSEEKARMKTSLEKRRSDVTGLAVTDEDVFMAVPAPNDFTFRVYRFTHALADPKLVVEKLRGCCGQMDVQTHAGKLWVPHNARHAVENFDREGKQLSKFGKAGKVKPADFGGCCEPKAMRVLPDGDILAAESGPPTCIKRFSATGEFKEVVALVEDTKGDCVRVTVEASPDGQRFYMLDTTRDAIRVFAAKK